MNISIDLPLLYTSCMVSIGESDQSLRVSLVNARTPDESIDDYFKATTGNNDSDGIRGTTGTLNSGLVLIRMKDEPTTSLHIAQLAHECVHAASFLMVSKGMKRGWHTEELQCYLVQYIIEKTLEKYLS